MFGHVNFHNNVVSILFTLEETDIDVFEVTRIVNSFNTAAGQITIKYIALFKTKFTANNAIFRLLVALNINAFHMAFADTDM